MGIDNTTDDTDKLTLYRGNQTTNMYKRYGFFADILPYAVWLYHRFSLSHRDIDHLLAERGITVSYRYRSQHVNNRAKLSHEPRIVREWGMRRFKTMKQAQRFLNVHAINYTLFNLGRDLVSAELYRNLRRDVFASWKKAAAV